MIDTICIYCIYPHVNVRTLEAECNSVTHNTLWAVVVHFFFSTHYIKKKIIWCISGWYLLNDQVELISFLIRDAHKHWYTSLIFCRYDRLMGWRFNYAHVSQTFNRADFWFCPWMCSFCKALCICRWVIVIRGGMIIRERPDVLWN